MQRRTIGMEKVEESVEMNPAVGVGGIAVRLREISFYFALFVPFRCIPVSL